MGNNSVGLGQLFLRLGFAHFAQPNAPTIEHLSHRPGRGPGLLALPLGSQGVQSRARCQVCLGQRRTKGRGRWRRGFGQLLPRFSGLGGPLCPPLAPTAGRWRPETLDACASLGKPPGTRLTPPTADRFGSEGVASTVFHGHLGRKGAPWRASHGGGRQAESGNLRWTAWLRTFKESLVHAQDRPSRKDEGFIDLEAQLCTHTLTE
jgi:hypothetical protein